MATLIAVVRGALVMVAIAIETGGGGIVRATIQVAAGAPPMFIGLVDA